MTTLLTVFCLLNTLVILCSGAVLDQYSNDNTAVSGSGLADAGNFLLLSKIRNTDVTADRISTDNSATSTSGDARSGNALFFRGGNRGIIKNSGFDVSNTAYDNEAQNTYGTSISGNQNVFNKIRSDSDVNLNNTSGGNLAQVYGLGAFGGTTGDVDAISGTQNQVAKKMLDSNLTFVNSATDNIAVNYYGGDAVAGNSNNAKETVASQTDFHNYAYNNLAINTYGKAISGSENNIEKASESNILLDTESLNNTAVSSYGDAVAGSQNNFKVLNSNTNLTINDFAANNNATASFGTAVGGSQTSANYLSNVNLELNAETEYNFAEVVEGDQVESSAAGVDVNLAKVVDSHILVNTSALMNKANNFETNPGSDAIAGTDVLLGSGEGNIVDVDATSNYNEAYAKYGDAVAGNRLEVFGNNNTISMDLEAAQNTAQSQYGNAVAGNYATVSGVYNYIVNQNLNATGNSASAPNGDAITNSVINIDP